MRKITSCLKLASKTQGRMAIDLLIGFAWFALLLFVTAMIPEFERKVFPVITSFSTLSMQCEGNDAIVSGMLRKSRSAQFIPDEHVVMLYDSSEDYYSYLKVEFLLVDRPFNRPIGLQSWGPWKLIDACNPENMRFDSWVTIFRHYPWHRLYTIESLSAPQPLPARG